MKKGRFGMRVKELRQQAQLTQAQLAKRTGLATSSIADLEQGRREPSLSTALKLAQAFGVQVTAFEAPAKSTKPAKRGRPRKGK